MLELLTLKGLNVESDSQDFMVCFFLFSVPFCSSTLRKYNSPSHVALVL